MKGRAVEGGDQRDERNAITGSKPTQPTVERVENEQVEAKARKPESPKARSNGVFCLLTSQGIKRLTNESSFQRRIN